MLRAMIADDEPLAREKLSTLLSRRSDVEVIARARNGQEVVEEVQKNRPDLLFLDVQMPGMDGFSVLEALGEHLPPVVVFVTAFEEYAIRAFHVHALDYLLKPYDFERLSLTVDRAIAALDSREKRDISSAVQRLAERLENRAPVRDRFVIKDSGRIRLLKLEQILYFEAAGNYVRVHVQDAQYLVRETMAALEARLDSRAFMRIHRSTIVNIDHIVELKPWFQGEYVVVLEDGTTLNLSRGYRERFQGLLQNTLA